MPSDTLSLFDEPVSKDTVRDFEAALDAWLTHQRTSVARKITLPSSIKAYTVLWQAFTEWCLAQSPVVTLERLGQADLVAFIDSRISAHPASRAAPSRLKTTGEFTPRHAWRLLTLIDGVLEVRAQATRSPSPNRCAWALLQSREDWLHANASRRTRLPDFLPPADARVLVHHLTSGLPRPGRLGADLSWQAVRNRCAVALHLGAGLTPADVRAMRVGSVLARASAERSLPSTVRVPAHGESPEREAPLVQWAARVLAYWLVVRAEQALAGDFLLPATRSGKPWGKVTHYDAVKAVLEDAGIDKSLVEGGAYRLRHTFALRQLRRGKPDDLVARWLGVVDTKVMDRYRRLDYASERPD